MVACSTDLHVQVNYECSTLYKHCLFLEILLEQFNKFKCPGFYEKKLTSPSQFLCYILSLWSIKKDMHSTKLIVPAGYMREIRQFLHYSTNKIAAKCCVLVLRVKLCSSKCSAPEKEMITFICMVIILVALWSFLTFSCKGVNLMLSLSAEYGLWMYYGLLVPCSFKWID